MALEALARHAGGPLVSLLIPMHSELYRELASKGRATANLPEALDAADNGRLEALFARAGEQVWGRRTNGHPGHLVIHEQRQPGDVDLLNEAVALAPPEEMPGDGSDLVNAVLRW